MNHTKKLLLLIATLFAANLHSFAQLNMTFKSHLPYPGKQLANIGGYVDSLGNEYALVGHTEGLSIVNVQDPANPFIVAEIPGPNSIWREVKTWQQYAYVTTEGGNQGLQVVDLRNLPGTVIPYHNWTPSITTNVGSYTLSTIHALHIDNGYAYLYGANNGSGIDGIVIADLADPWNPTLAGYYNGYYVHDGYVRNDTVWACHIYDGFFSAINVIDKANPVQLSQVHTPSNFTHNSWLSDNSQYLFTTDEVDNSYLAAYDVSDVNNIIFMDKIQSQNTGSNSIVHNTHILNDFAITSWYNDGVVITDVHRPQNLVNVGFYDTNALSGGGFNGCWGVYPFLPSGNLVISDIEEGLFVVAPNYIRACYLEGSVLDSVCGAPISGVTVTIVGDNVTDVTDASGEYKTGTPNAGTYTITFSKPGYVTKTVSNVILANTVVTNVNVELISNSSVSLSGLVTSQSGAPIANIPVTVSNANYAYSYNSDTNGEFSQCGLIADNYDIVAGQWGYQTFCDNELISTGNLDIVLEPGIYDDFALDYGWTVNSTATAGIWTRVVPAATMSGSITVNPGTDASGDCLNKAYVTGNNSASVGADDIDDGYTMLTSPIFDASTLPFARLKYARWFYNGGGAGAVNDSLIIKLTNGTQTVVLETVLGSTPGTSTWVEKDFALNNSLIPLTSTMQLMVYAVDAAPGHLVEAGFDHFRVVSDSVNATKNLTSKNVLSYFPNPIKSTSQLHYTFEHAGKYEIDLSDLSGRVIKHYTTINPSGTLVLPLGLANGTYFIASYLNGVKQSTEKLVVLED